MCTVEAQAATENLKEEIEIVASNLQTRHQRVSRRFANSNISFPLARCLTYDPAVP